MPINPADLVKAQQQRQAQVAAQSSVEDLFAKAGMFDLIASQIVEITKMRQAVAQLNATNTGLTKERDDAIKRAQAEEAKAPAVE